METGQKENANEPFYMRVLKFGFGANQLRIKF